MMLAKIGLGVMVSLSFESIVFELFLMPPPKGKIKTGFMVLDAVLLVCGIFTSILSTILIVKNF